MEKGEGSPEGCESKALATIMMQMNCKGGGAPWTADLKFHASTPTCAHQPPAPMAWGQSLFVPNQGPRPQPWIRVGRRPPNSRAKLSPMMRLRLSLCLRAPNPRSWCTAVSQPASPPDLGDHVSCQYWRPEFQGIFVLLMTGNHSKMFGRKINNIFRSLFRCIE